MNKERNSTSWNTLKCMLNAERRIKAPQQMRGGKKKPGDCGGEHTCSNEASCRPA